MQRTQEVFIREISLKDHGGKDRKEALVYQGGRVGHNKYFIQRTWPLQSTDYPNGTGPFVPLYIDSDLFYNEGEGWNLHRYAHHLLDTDMQIRDMAITGKTAASNRLVLKKDSFLGLAFP